MDSAQRDLLLALDLRAEGVEKVANLLRTALGGQAKQASTLIAGDMENFLASDVIYSQRVAPLIEQTLKAAGAEGQTLASSHFLPNIGWLEPNTVQSRITGQPASSSQSGALAPGTPRQRAEGGERRRQHAGERTDAEPHQRRRQPDVHGHGRKRGRIPRDERQGRRDRDRRRQAVEGHPGRSTRPNPARPSNVEHPGRPGARRRGVEDRSVRSKPVPGETDTENNKSTYLAIFGS